MFLPDALRPPEFHYRRDVNIGRDVPTIMAIKSQAAKKGTSIYRSSTSGKLLVKLFREQK